MTQNQSGNLFQSSMDGLTTTLALLCAAMITPWAAGQSEAWAVGMFMQVYGPDFAGAFRIIWLIAVGASIFFASRAGISIALTMVSAWAVMRFGLLPV